MEKKFVALTKKEIKRVKTPALAQKHDCSDVYVRCVLTGLRAANTELAQMILQDARDILAVYNRDTGDLIKKKK